MVSESLSSELCRPERGEGGRETWGEEETEERKIWAERGDCDVSSPAPTARKRGLQMERKGGLDWRFMREDYGWRMRVGSARRWEVGGEVGS